MIGLAALFFVLASGVGSATVVEEVAKDFQPLSGYIIMPVQGEFLIDQDAAKGVSVGDLFSVVKPGEKIVHPVTKEVLGNLDEVKGLLQVTKVKSGYSYGKPLSAEKGIERGDVVRRFENVAATFWDYTGQGEEFFAELRAALPNLEWQDYSAAQVNRPTVPAASTKVGTQLIFILRHDGLEVRDAGFQPLHAYPLPGQLSAKLAPVAALPPAAAPVSAGSLEQRLQAVEQQQTALLNGRQMSGDTVPYKLEKSGTRAGDQLYEAAFPGFVNVGALEGVTMMSSFLHDGERFLLAATDGEKLRIYSVGEGLTLVATGDTSYVAQILSVHWWHPETGGPLYLAVTAWNTRRLESALFLLQDDRLVPVQEHIPYILGAFDRDGDGRPELLLGQAFDRSTFFGAKINELRLVAGKFSALEVPFPLPRDFAVQGSLFTDLTGDGNVETVFVRNGFLHIYVGKKEIYKSPKQVGGTLSVAIFETNPDAKQSLPGYAGFDVPPVAADLDGDGRPELLAISSDRGILAAPGLGPGINESWLAVLKYRDNMYVKGILGERLDVPLQGLTVAGGRALFVASTPSSILGQGGSSHLLAFPLAQ